MGIGRKSRDSAEKRQRADARKEHENPGEKLLDGKGAKK